MPNNTINEVIDERILRLLGLEDVFDLDYDTYTMLLKEAIVTGSKKLPQEELAILANERKRIRGKQGRFTPKKEKITADKIATTRLLRPSKSSSLSIQKISKPTSQIGGGLVLISTKLDGILKSLLDQNNLERKSAEERRKEREEDKRKKKEARLEGGLKALQTVAQKVLAPVQGILDKIIRFVLFTLLGRAFKLFLDWTSDPKNKGKLESVGRFLKDWWPALLGAWFFFANPLGKFIRTVVGTVLKLTFKIAKFAIPKLLSFIRANPLASLLIGGAAAAGIGAYTASQQNESKRGELKDSSTVTPQQTAKTGKTPGSSQLMQEQILQRGFGGFNRGGSIFSGIVDRNSGTTVSGAGPDTQFFPIEGGGGAVLQKGESVLQVGARERMIEDHGIDPLAYNVGSNANKPRAISGGVFGRTYGGLIGLSNGGAIGIAAHHLKQDEALSSLTPGINDFTRPGGVNWSKVSMNTPVHSYTDSVGQETIGWGSTYYDSILNGKKPVRKGDKITKGKADEILSTNIANLAKEYSSKIPNWNKMTDKQRAGLLLVGYNAPYGPIGAYSKLTDALQRGDIRAAAQNVQRGGPNPQRIALERNLLMSGPLNTKNLVGPRIVGEKKVGSGIPFIPPFMYNRLQKKKKGGAVEIGESTGANIPGATDDRQLIAVQPGETKYIFTKLATERGAAELANLIQAKLDPNSKAAMSGKYTLPPPSRKGKGQFEMLPPIDASSNSPIAPQATKSVSTMVPSFSVVAAASFDNRKKITEMYGIM